MPGKSQRKKGKHSAQSKKRKGRPSHPAAVVQQPVVPQSQQPVDSPSTPVHPADVPVQVAKLTNIQYPFVATELRTIGILAGIMLIILVVLALFLS